MKIRRHDTQWAAQCAVAYELARRGHRFAFTMGNEPAIDLRVTSPHGTSYSAQIKGQQGKASAGCSDWYIRCPAPDDPTLFFFVAVPTDHEGTTCAPRIAIMTAAEVKEAMDEYKAARRARGTSGAKWVDCIRWTDTNTERHRERWKKLPA